MNIKLSVVIPSYNETENLKRGSLEEINNYLSKQPYAWEVIVSDDGSPDLESRKLASEYCKSHKNFRYLDNEHAGKSFAVWAGVKAAVGEIVLFTDMDQSTPISEISKLLPYYEQGFDVVVGSRGIKRKNSSIFRLVASTVFREFRRVMLLHDIVDTQAGFKSFRGPVAKEIFPLLQTIKNKGEKVTGWKVTSFDVELLLIAERKGYKLAEVPVEWEDRDISTGKSRSGSKFVQESLDMLREIIRVKSNDLRGEYN